ncbi:MAG TPA: antitoxin [Pseudonocardiaceae bacterium]|nr:antitoxin [Pseudonocardiaceae bacterium]
MRTTIDLPEDIHQLALSIARDTGHTLSETVTDLIRRGLGPSPKEAKTFVSPVTGLPVFSLGSPVTTEDVRALEDDE